MPPTETGRPAAGWQLADWLAYQERVHPRAIELGLDRVREVAVRLGLLPARATTLTVAGPNGKGSSATLAAGIYSAAGYRTGRYLSPHLLDYNERIAIDGVEASDDALCAAFAAIEQARGAIALTYFEFGTLAALWLFREAGCAVQVLEVGLGGRLDAVNIVDADCALVTNIGLDHTDWLGPDREHIGYEKAGIMRAGKPAICAEAQPPRSLLDHAAAIGATLRLASRDFRHARRDRDWFWSDPLRTYAELPPPALAGDAQFANAAGVLAAISALQAQRPVEPEAIRSGLRALRLRGRYEKIGRVVLDVAHNVESAQVLVANLAADPVAGRTRLVLGMLSDKPVEAVCELLSQSCDAAFFAGLPPPRGLAAAELQMRAKTAGLAGLAAGTVDAAFRLAMSQTGPDDRLVVCGSFLTVSAAARLIDE
ncbi:MAG: bifunctional tetrahydrofolate synthase/dihydrofolate synthase [Nevskia sp.]